MKARVPYQYDQSAKGARRRAVMAAMLLFSRALFETGERKAFINRWSGAFDNSLGELAGYQGSGYFNREWTDQLFDWTEKMELEPPKNYRLIIPGVIPAVGSEAVLLLLSECFGLTQVGYAHKRIHRVWDKYAELSGLYTTGVAKYSAKELYEWADKNGIIYQ